MYAGGLVNSSVEDFVNVEVELNHASACKENAYQ